MGNRKTIDEMEFVDKWFCTAMKEHTGYFTGQEGHAHSYCPFNIGIKSQMLIMEITVHSSTDSPKPEKLRRQYRD